LALLLTLIAQLTATFGAPISFQWYPRDLVCEATGLEIRAGLSTGVVGFVGFALSLIVFCYGSVYRTVKRQEKDAD